MSDKAIDTPQRPVQVLDLVIDLELRTVRRAAQAIDLPELSFRLLAALVRHAPDTVSKDDLIHDVWNSAAVSDETLAQRIRLLRQALDDDGQSPRYFSSVRGRGYRLLCPVEEARTGPERKSRVAAILVGALAALVAVAMGLVWQFGDEPDTPRQNSLAVLPFADLSAESGYQHFADGMQEELLTRLTMIGEIRVSSRTSVEAYRSTTLSIPDIAEEMGVGAVIEGSVRVDNDRIRITVQLIDGSNDQHLWADTYERALSVQSIFSIQDEVARQIAEALKVEYAGDAAPGTIQLPTASLDAYSQYLLGQYHTFRQTPENLALAVRYLEEATRLDPEFAEAFAALGLAYSFRGTNYGNLPPREAYPRAREAALAALALNADLPDARTLYAEILTWFDWNFAAAEREYRRAMELDSANVLGYALFLSAFERHDEAIELIERRLDKNPGNEWVHVNAAWRYLNADRFDQAVKHAEQAGQHPDAPAALGSALLVRGDVERAMDVFEQDVQLRGRLPLQLANLAVARYSSGRIAEGENLLAELEQIADARYLSPAMLAAVYFASGDADRGFSHLDRAVAVKARDAIFLRVTPMLDNHRDDPRYRALLRSVGLDTDQ